MVLASDHKGGIGECWWAGHSPGWALTSHSLSAQGPWKSLTVVFTVLNEGQLQRTAAILRVGLGQEYIAVLPGGPLTSGGWGQRAVGSYSRVGRKARGQRRNSGFIESCLYIQKNCPLCSEGRPTRALHSGSDPTADATSHEARFEVGLARECYLGLWRALGKSSGW